MQTDAVIIQSQLDMIRRMNLRPQGLKVKRFVYASTNPKAAADLHVKHFLAEHISTSVEVNSACYESHTVRYTHHGNEDAFEMQWVHWPERSSWVLKFEQYFSQLHGNMSQSSANNWDHYMDNHAGFLIDNCDPIIQSLDADNVPYFLAKHSRALLAIFYQDPGGNVFEAVCVHTSVDVDQIEQWDFCLDPKPRDATINLDILTDVPVSKSSDDATQLPTTDSQVESITMM